MPATRSILLSCLVALGAIACASEPEPSATEATEPEATTGAEEVAPEPVVAEAPPPAPPAAEPAPEPEPPKPPSAGILVTHKVKDYDAWKAGFDAGQQQRADGGAIAHAVMRDLKNPKSISIWAGTNDLAKVQEMVGSEEMKKAMKDAGVIGKPTVIAMNIVAMSPPVEGPMPGFGAIVEHKVKDFDAWKVAFDEHDQTRKDAGISGWAVNQDVEDPNHVYVWLEAHDKDKLAEFLKSKDLKEKMKAAGVKGAPKVTQVEALEWKMYNQ